MFKNRTPFRVAVACITLMVSIQTLVLESVAYAASFSISNESPFLGEEITITGSGLNPDTTYYLYNDEAGPAKDFTDTTYQDVTAKQFTATGGFGTGTYYSHEYAEFDKVLVFLNYYDSVAATPLFRIGASDIYWTNGGGAATTKDINGTGENSWRTWDYLFDKDQGVPDTEWNFTKVGTNNVYVDSISKHPTWVVMTDSSGNFSKVVNAPRVYSRNLDLDFTFKLFDPSTKASEDVGAVTLNSKFNDYRSAADMIEYHYIHVRPNGLPANSGAVFANQIIRSIDNNRTSDWEVGYVGAVFDELGYTDLRNEQARRLKDTIRHGTADLRCYPIGANNYTDCTFAAWATIIPAYEETGDSALYNALVDILTYAMVGYNATYDNFSHAAGGSLNQFWIDAGGGKPQFFWYMGELLNDDTYKTHAKNMINTMIDDLQHSEGWFHQKYYFVTDTVSPEFWDGGQGWALMGLIEFKELIKDEAEEAAFVTKIDVSLEKLADNLSSRPISDLRADERRTTQIMHHMYKLAEDEDFPAAKRAVWRGRADELFLLALKTMNAEHDNVLRYGLTYRTNGNAFTFAFPDLFMLRTLSEFNPNTEFFPNNTGSNYSIQKPMESQSIYQAFLDDTGGWKTSISHYSEVTSDGTILQGTSQPDKVVKYLKRDMTASVGSGNVGLAIEEWEDNYRRWSMSSSTQQNVDITFTNLQADKQYFILRDEKVWKQVSSNNFGTIAFTYDGGFSTHIFELSTTPDSRITTTTIMPPRVSKPPSCTDNVSSEKIELFQVDTEARSATLYFSPASYDVNSYYVYYGVVDNDQAKYGASFPYSPSNGVVTFKINDLLPEIDYHFVVRSGNGCAPGEWGNSLTAETPKDSFLGKVQHYLFNSTSK